jgi:metal-sulfur cluster biosynthetic enzyme
MERTEIDHESRHQEIWRALSTVCDPELDEAVTELGFIQEVSIGPDGDVWVRFRLLTFWCSANFTYLMASDMRDAIARLAWTREISMQQIDHFVSAEVSSGSSSGKSFREIFRLKAKEDLEGIRSTFRRKSFQRRQEALLRHLLGRGETIPDLSSMCLAELNQLNLDNGGGAFRTRYIQARTALGFCPHSSVPAFHDVQGRALDPGEFANYLQQLRRVRLNTEVDAEICRGLLAVRSGAKQEGALVQIKGAIARETAAAFEPPEYPVGVRSFKPPEACAATNRECGGL